MHANSNISLPNNHLILLQFQHQNLLIQFLSSTLRLCVLLELYLSRFIVLVNKALWSWKEKRKEPTKKIELKIPLENMTLSWIQNDPMVPNLNFLIFSWRVIHYSVKMTYNNKCYEELWPHMCYNCLVPFTFD